jgi:hypothetical protein
VTAGPRRSGSMFLSAARMAQTSQSHLITSGHEQNMFNDCDDYFDD